MFLNNMVFNNRVSYNLIQPIFRQGPFTLMSVKSFVPNSQLPQFSDNLCNTNNQVILYKK